MKLEVIYCIVVKCIVILNTVVLICRCARACMCLQIERLVMHPSYLHFALFLAHHCIVEKGFWRSGGQNQSHSKL